MVIRLTDILEQLDCGDDPKPGFVDTVHDPARAVASQADGFADEFNTVIDAAE